MPISDARLEGATRAVAKELGWEYKPDNPDDWMIYSPNPRCIQWRNVALAALKARRVK